MTMSDQSDIFVNGDWRRADGAPFTSLDPVRGDVVWSGRAADDGNVATACAAAREAFRDWRLTAAEQRIGIAREFARILADRREEIARTMARETGKALWDCRDELGAACAKVDVSIRARASG